MRTKRTDTIEFNFYVSSELYRQISKLQDAGLSLSAIARLAVQKCAALSLDNDDGTNVPKRLLLYLHTDEARQLDELAAREGDRSRARTLRRLIITYLRINSSAIDTLF